MQFGVLGPLEVRSAMGRLALGSTGERSLLAVLILHAGQLLPTDRLVYELWGESPPKAAVKTVQVYVSRLRKTLGAQTIRTRPPGYLLEAADDQIDACRFERLSERGRKALEEGDAPAARRLLGEALSLWRGAALSDFAYEPFAQAEIARLEELRLTALEERIEADLRCGGSAALVPELQALIARNPLRERLRAQLMTALYRSGRQADALEAYRDARAALIEELAIEPGRELRDLERAVLRQDPALEPSPQPLIRGHVSPFVGRVPELRSLLAALADAESGHGGICLVSGEPGAGKTRLAEELVGRAREQGFRVLRGRAWEAAGATPFWPWVQVLRGHLRQVDAAALRDQLRRSAPELAELLPDVREVLGELPRPSVRDPETLRFRIFDAVASLLVEVARQQGPLLVVLDDLHAADEPSLLLLQFIAGAIDDEAVLLLGAHRDTAAHSGDPLPQVLAEVARSARVTRIRLEGLDPSHVGAYIAATTALSPPQRLVHAIHERTGGNALFMVECTRLLGHAGDLDGVDVATTVPAGVHEAVSRRLADLPRHARHALAVAAVLGREFEPQLVEAVTGRSGAEGIDVAIGAGLVTAAPGSPGTLRFSHSLVRDALYESIERRQRRKLHRQAAEALQRGRVPGPEPHLASIAYHSVEADDPEAAAHAAAAARFAAAQLAFEEAVRLYELALSALGQQPDPHDVCELLLGLGDARARAGDDAGARQTLLQAAAAARRVRSPELLGRAALGYGGRWVWTKGRGDPELLPLLEEAIAALPDEDSPLRARLLARMAAGPLAAQGDRTRPRRFDLTEEAVEVARRLGDPAVLAWALDGRKVAIWGPDTLEEQWKIMDELRELAERAGDPEQIVDAHICTLIKLFERSELERFDVEYARARHVAEELGQPGQRWLVAVHAPIRALTAGALADAEQLIEEVFDLGKSAVPWNARTSRLMQRFLLCSLAGRPGDVREELSAAAARESHYPSLRAALAHVYAELDDPAACRTALESATGDGLDGIPLDETWLLTVGLLADAVAYLGDRERAALMYDRLTPYAHRMLVAPLEVCQGTAALPLGALAAALGDASAAADWYRRAAEENERTGAWPWAAHARRRHGELLLSSEATEAGRRLLEQARASYERLGMGVWSDRCSEVLAGQLPTVCR